jgi:hypothetical protein
MKPFTFLLIITVLFSCAEAPKKEIPTVNAEQSVEATFSFDLLTDNLLQIDTTAHYITYEVSPTFEIGGDELRQLVENQILNEREAQQIDNQFYYESFSKDLSQEKMGFIQASQKDIEGKIEVNHQFSYPFVIDADRLVVFSNVSYKKTSFDHIKGGHQSLFFIVKDEGRWEKEKEIMLTEF